jgi:hypothetical protein
VQVVNVVLRFFHGGIDHGKPPLEAFCLFLPLLASMTVLFRPVQQAAVGVNSEGEK